MKTVLLIDDDREIQEACRLIFERAGYRIVPLSTGDGLFDDRFEEPDIFIIDRQLTGADGVDICRFLKNRIPAFPTPVIVFSASPNVCGPALQAGADKFIGKPFKTKELLLTVSQLLDGFAKTAGSC